MVRPAIDRDLRETFPSGRARLDVRGLNSRAHNAKTLFESKTAI